jgi:hypothetical protein
VISTALLTRRRRRIQARQLLIGEDGAAYSLGMAFMLPLYLLLVALFVECTLALNVKIATQHAAIAAARAATLWVPAEIGNERRLGMIHMAAVNALWPHASGSLAHASIPAGTLEIDDRGPAACIAAYRQHSRMARDESYLRRKWQFAAKATRITVSASSPEYNADITVKVEFERPFFISAVGAFLSMTAGSSRDFRSHAIAATATLQKEGPKSADQSLGISYIRDYGFNSRSVIPSLHK